MAQQALQGAQARLDQLQRQYDEAFVAYAANPSNDLKKERYTELKLSLHKAEDFVNSLATAAGAAAASGWQVYCPLYFPACILFCSFRLVPLSGLRVEKITPSSVLQLGCELPALQRLAYFIACFWCTCYRQWSLCMLICLWCLTATSCCQCSLLASCVAVWQLHISILHYSMLVSHIMRASGLCRVRLESLLPSTACLYPYKFHEQQNMLLLAACWSSP